jgi:hypothetical protein
MLIDTIINYGTELGYSVSKLDKHTILMHKASTFIGLNLHGTLLSLGGQDIGNSIIDLNEADSLDKLRTILEQADAT